MINFRTAFWQNFMSTGNVGTTIRLDGAPTTLIIGKNGHGKSTLLDVLCFALYGKAFRNITKNQLINSVNGKACKVAVEFDTEGKNYKVVRGIKPNLFEIYIEGKLVQQDAATKDYQKILEKQILKMNQKTFTQVVILGSSSFTPFMKLGASHRREVIEDILDIKIFSTMGVVLKDKVSETKTELAEVTQKIANLKTQIEAQRNLIEVMKKSKEDSTKETTEKIDIYKRRIEALEKDVTILEGQIKDKTAEIDAMTQTILAEQPAVDVLRDLQSSMKTWSDEREFYMTHDECPTCKQGIDADHKAHTIEDIEGAMDIGEENIKTFTARVDALKKLARECQDKKDELRQLEIDRAGITSEIKSIRQNIVDAEDSLVAQAADTGDLDAEKGKLKILAAAITSLLEEKIELTEKRNLQEVATALLKDSGIKTNVVREYLPLMNKLINKYLQVQDSFIQFEIDEQFEETIKSRYRDEFSYASFSEGERQRIDLAILFTWRQIARMKNSANTNLLILDEVMDGSLDTEGNDSAQDLIDALAKDGTHVFVVTHSVDKHIDKFDRTLKFEKKGNYSQMTQL